MRRQFLAQWVLRAATAALVAGSLVACGVKGPLQPPPARAPTAPGTVPKDHPATPPATTSPALPPPIPGTK